MATENKGVMVYLPPDLHKALEDYCAKNKITRKDKYGQLVVSLGTGIVHHLRSHLLGAILGTDTRSLVTQEAWDDLKADVADVREQLAQLSISKESRQEVTIKQVDDRIFEIIRYHEYILMTIQRLDDLTDEVRKIKSCLDDKADRDCVDIAIATYFGVVPKQQPIAPAANHVKKTLDVLMGRKGFGKTSS
jgi:hypothetical protein